MKSGLRFALSLGLAVVSIGCQSGYTPQARDMGAVSGAALGAGLGAIVGNQVGNSGEGLAIGAAAGALVGGLVGNTQDTMNLRRDQQDEMLLRQQRELERQRREIEDLRRQEYHDNSYRRFEGGDSMASDSTRDSFAQPEGASGAWSPDSYGSDGAVGDQGGQGSSDRY